MSKQIAFLALVAAVLMACSPTGGPTASVAGSSAPLADVLTYKGNAARTAEHPGPGPASTPASIWRVEHDSLFRTAPLIAGGQVVVGAEDGTILILDAATGSATNVTIEDGFRATGSIAEGTLYIAGLGGQLWAIPLADPDAGWSVDGVHEESFITLTGDLVVAGTPDHLVAYERADGAEAWSVAVPGAERAALGNGVVYAGGRDSGTLTAVGLDGEKRWEFDTGADEVLTPTVWNDAVYVATRGAAGGGSTVSALDLDGGERWRAEFDGRIGSHGADGGRVYVTITVDPSSLTALDSSTGDVEWQHDFDGPDASVLAIAGGRIYVVTQAEGLVALEASSGEVAWQVEAGSVARAGLAISGGVVFVATQDLNGSGRVLAFR